MVMVKPWESTIPHSPPDLGAAGVGAAFGRVQLRRLPQLLKRRRALAARYDEMGRDWEVLHPPPQSSDIIYRYVVKLPPGRLDALFFFGWLVGWLVDFFFPGGCAPRTPRHAERVLVGWLVG